MIEFDSVILDAVELRARNLNESILYGRRPRVSAATNQGYTGGTVDGYERNWTPFARHPDSELIIGRNYLLARSYEQHRNNPMVFGPTDVLAEAVGELIPTSLAQDSDTREILESSWKEWCEQAGSDGVATWSDICESMVGGAAQGGDIGIQYDHREDLGGIHPLRINLIDAYRIASPSVSDNSETCRFGVVYNQGAESAYYVSREDSTSLSRDGFYRFERIRNGRPNFTLFRRPDSTRRPGQSRGTPIVSTVLQEVKELGDYRRAMVRGAGKRARLTAIIESGDPSQVNAYFQKIKTAESTGSIAEAAALREGLKPNLVTTPDASTLTIPSFMKYVHTPTDVTDSGYESFVITNLKIIASAWGLPFEVAYQIWQDASYSRARILYLREGVTARRWRARMAPVATTAWRLHVQYMLAKNRKLKFSPDILQVKWHGQTQEYMDLGAEISAEADARQSGVMSPQTTAMRTGRDAIQEMKQTLDYARARKEEMKRRDLTESDIAAAFGPVKDRTTVAQESTTQKGNP